MAYRRRHQQQLEVSELPSNGRASSKSRVQSDEEEIAKSWSWDDDDDDNDGREDIVDDDDDSNSPSLAAKAIRASSAAQRDSSLSSAYAAHPSYIRRPSSDATPPKYSPMSPKMQDSSPSSYQYTSMKNLSDSKSGGFWNSLARKAKSILDDDIPSPNSTSSTPGTAGDEASQLPKRGGQREHSKHFQSPETQQKSDSAAFHKGFGAIASSLTHISGKVGNVLEEGFSIVENRAADIIQETRKLQARRKFGTPGMNEQGISDESQVRKSELQTSTQPQMESDMEIQLKASRDVAMAMAAKTKVLLRELKTVKADFAFAKERCAQLEEENRVLRGSMENGDNPEDDDLIRLQLETLLAEKARLAHENSVYARENRFLREIVEYHQLTMQDVVYLDENNEEVSQVYPPMGCIRSVSPSTKSFSTTADVDDDDSFSTHA